MLENNILEINNATKLYSGTCGINNFSASMKTGEIVACVGPNGAGKSTLVKLTAGLIKCSAGEIKLNGILTSEASAKRNIGYMQENLSFYEKMTVYEILDFICEIKYSGLYCDQINKYLKRYDIYDKRNSYIKNLSLGMRRKLAIIMALIGTPDLIVLDEPTNGVDTAGILQLKHDLSECVRAGSIVILTSHVLEWIEKICTRCIFLKESKMIQDVEVGSVSLVEEYERIYC